MDHLPADVELALRASDRRPAKGPRYFAKAESGTYPLLNLWPGGFAIAAEDAPKLGGFVDLLHNEERLARCLVVLAEEEGGVARYEYKRRTDAVDGPPRDYAATGPTPVALIGSSI